MPIGSIIIKHDPVKLWERYLLVCHPEISRGVSEAVFANYQNTDEADGGFWSCSFQVRSRENTLRELFEDGLQRQVEVWDTKLQQDFEGYIHEMVLNLPPDSYTITLEGMSNKLLMRTDYDADGITERTTLQQNLDSQEKYGIWDGILLGGDVNDVSVGDQATKTYLELRAFPRPEIRIGGGSGNRPSLEIFCRGYVHTLDRRVFNQTATAGVQSLSSEVNDILVAVGEFIAASDLEVNTTTVTREHDSDRRALELIRGMVDLGDNSGNRWLFYALGKSAVEARGRRVYLRPAALVTLS